MASWLEVYVFIYNKKFNVQLGQGRGHPEDLEQINPHPHWKSGDSASDLTERD
jgi:hypothetical protein